MNKNYCVIEIYDSEIVRVCGTFTSRQTAKKFANSSFEKKLKRHLAEDDFNSCPWDYRVYPIKVVQIKE